MAFVKEYISEEDKKYGHTSTWRIDRERGLFLIHEYYGREDNLIRFRLCSYVDGSDLVKVDARDRSAEYSKELNVNHAAWYDLFNFKFFIDESDIKKKEELTVSIIEAIDEFGRTGVNKRDDQCKVKITPFRN